MSSLLVEILILSMSVIVLGFLFFSMFSVFYVIDCAWPHLLFVDNFATAKTTTNDAFQNL